MTDLAGWPGLALLCTAAALAFALDLARERALGPRGGTAPRSPLRTALTIALAAALAAAALATVIRLDTLTGGALL